MHLVRSAVPWEMGREPKTGWRENPGRSRTGSEQDWVVCCNDPLNSAPGASGAGSTHTPKRMAVMGARVVAAGGPTLLACDSVTCWAHSGNRHGVVEGGARVQGQQVPGPTDCCSCHQQQHQQRNFYLFNLLCRTHRPPRSEVSPWDGVLTSALVFV